MVIPFDSPKCHCKFCYKGQYFSWNCEVHGSMVGTDYLAICKDLFEQGLISVDMLVDLVKS